MFCTKCGRKIPDDAEFCPYCGRKIDKIKNLEDDSVKHAAEDKVHTSSVPPVNQKTSSSRHIRGAIVIFLFIIGTCFLIASGGLPGKKVAGNGQGVTTTQEEKQKIPAPASFAHFEVDKDLIGQPVAFIQLKNDSDKTIDGFKVILTAKDNFDTQVKEFGTGDGIKKLMSQRTIRPHELSEANRGWNLYGYENGTKFHIRLYEIHYTDGSSWKAEQSDSVEADATKTDKVVQR